MGEKAAESAKAGKGGRVGEGGVEADTSVADRQVRHAAAVDVVVVVVDLRSHKVWESVGVKCGGKCGCLFHKGAGLAEVSCTLVWYMHESGSSS